MGGKRALTAADILALPAKVFELHEVEMPEWGEGAVAYLREPDAAEGMDLDEEAKGLAENPKKAGQSLFVLLRFTMCDEHGARIFESTAQCKAVLGRRSLDELGRVAAVARKLTQEDGTTEKNASSGAAPAASPTA